MNGKDLSARLRATFALELSDQSQLLNTELLALEAAPTDSEHLRAVFRVFHTLKGAARAANVTPLEQLCHELETLLARARDGNLPLAEKHFRVLFTAADVLTDAGERLRNGDELDAGRIDEVLAALRRETALPHTVRPVVEKSPPPATPATPPAKPATPAQAEAPPRKATVAMTRTRVDPERLDALMVSASDLLLNSQRFHDRQRELRALREHAGRSMQLWSRVRRQVLERVDDDGGLHAALEALDTELRKLAHFAGELYGSTQADARSFARTSASLAEGAQQLRMLPLGEITEGLPRVVRDLATESGKQVRLEVVGASVRADRLVLAAIGEALLQLVRNAIDHGIETPEKRVAAGKPQQALIRISADLDGEHIRVRVEDDGAGIDYGALRAQLQQRGLPAPEDESELLRVLVRQGISTRAEATAISGRGVGLDIVHAALVRVHGSVAVQSRRGQGTCFTLTAPTSLLAVHALTFRLSGQEFALPAARIARVLRLRTSDVRRAEGRDVISFNESTVPLISLASVLGPPLAAQPIRETAHALVLSAGEQLAACLVDEVLDEREIVVRPVNGHHAPRHISGAAQLSSGRLALFLNTDSILTEALTAGATVSLAVADEPRVSQKRARILVVDDSITTRTLEQGILEAAGYEVMTAVDGAHAWRLIQEEGCDLVLSDVEMPRMDGFALCQAIRGSSRFQSLPVILVSALETPEHRERGLHVGADAYLGKSSFDQDRVLEIVHQLIGPAT